jgi:transposase
MLHLEHTDAYRTHPVHIEMGEFSDVRFKQRVVIEFLTAEKVSPIEIHRRMQTVYVDQCTDVSTVRRWVRQIKDGELGQADLSDKTRSGRPVTASDQLHQDRVEELIRGKIIMQL